MQKFNHQINKIVLLNVDCLLLMDYYTSGLSEVRAYKVHLQMLKVSS